MTRDELAHDYAMKRGDVGQSATGLAYDAYAYADAMLAKSAQSEAPFSLPTPRGDRLYWMEQSAGSQVGYTREQAAAVGRRMLAWAATGDETAGKEG